MSLSTHVVPVATRAEIERGYDGPAETSGIYVDGNGEFYLVPIDPASLDDSDCCQ